MIRAHSRRLLCKSFLSAAVLITSIRLLPAQQPATLLSGLPPGAVSAKKSFVIASAGQAYLYNPSAGIQRLPFLAGAHRPFGFSSDARYFAYSKSNGALPGFSLYRVDLAQRTETRVGSGMVVSAAWSPTEPKLAYVEMESAVRFRLVLQDFATGTIQQVAAGLVDAESVAWSTDGREFVFTTAQANPASAAAHIDSFRFQLNAFNLKTGTSHVVGNGRRGAYLNGKLFPVDALQAASSGDGIYSTVLEGGRLVVKVTNAAGVTKTAGQGSLYAATGEAVVLQQITSAGTTYQYVTSTPQAPTLSAQTFAAATSPWKLPYGGSAYMVQGGADYNSGVCDGANCLITAHFAELGFALDWQQHTEENQGNDHVLATDAGTVVGIDSSVTCNVASPACPDYTTGPCNVNFGAGNYVSIAHPDGTYSFYAHLKAGSVQVTVGQAVSQGTFLAIQGHSGGAASYNNYLNCGDHLHFQRQVGPGVWNQSIPTDFSELNCALSCTVSYDSANTETGGGTGTLSVVLAPVAVTGATTTTGNQVTLPAPAPAGGTTVTLTSANPALASVPANVTVPAGATSATFTITTQPVASDTNVDITASTSGNTGSATLVLKTLSVSALTLSASTVQAGTPVNGNGVDLNGPAGQAGFSVALLSSNTTAASVPASINVAAGSSTASFNITTSTVTADTQVTISASGGGVTKPAVLTVTAAPVAPAAPANPSPANGATGVPTTPTLSWSASSGAASYDVYFGTAANPPLATNVTATSWTPGSLSAGTTYHWTVVAKNSTGSTSSAAWSFTTAASAPGTFSNLSPANGATGVSATPTLSWSASSGAASYDVYFGTAANPPLATNVTATSWAPGSLSASTPYYWTVVAKNSAGSTTSATWSFTTAAGALGTFSNLSPANGATGVPLTPTLSWSTSSGAASYDVYFGTAANPPLAANVTATSWAPGQLSGSTPYFWRVVAKNSGGTYSSATWSFTTVSTAPGAFSIVFPSDGATGVTTSPRLLWSTASGATSYGLYLGTSPLTPRLEREHHRHKLVRRRLAW